ncbi:uncharacterized protein TNCV_3503741 [Trichonephila clavipes]|uniref:Uncharacterized protein n=1 Tax=Trichonephila clavipes TaxID=2585209 RepID=A0A8X6S8M6_TRICX|nr:uncharacterized protein TNCV_3503741 [Trichonephila clavipes]
MSRTDENMISIQERKNLRFIFGGIQENGAWRKRSNLELYRSYKESDIVKFIKIQRIKWAATRGLLATDHVVLNHGQVMWTTPELAPPYPNYYTTPTGGGFSSRQI